MRCDLLKVEYCFQIEVVAHNPGNIVSQKYIFWNSISLFKRTMFYLRKKNKKIDKGLELWFNT